MNSRTMASISNTASEDALLRARVEDAVRLCEIRSCPRFVGFLDERQQTVARAVLHHCGGTPFLFFGGYEDAERTLLGVFPSYMEPDPAAFPILPLGFSYRREASLNHRDFLGTLLSLGVKRETVGDIVCGEGLTVAFVEEELAAHFASGVDKVGGEGVRIQCPYEGGLPGGREFEERRDTVASPRLDAVLKVMIGTSREEAAHRIAAGLVSVNHVPCLSASAAVKEGDRVSVRGEGRFLVDALGPPTKKGRLFVTVKKYR